jgi:hypothetical protein
MNLTHKSLSELQVIQDKFIDLHIHFVRHPKKHYEFLSRIQECIKQKTQNKSSSSSTTQDMDDWYDFQYMGGWDNPYFAINNKHAKLARAALKKQQKKEAIF